MRAQWLKPGIFLSTSQHWLWVHTISWGCLQSLHPLGWPSRAKCPGACTSPPQGTYHWPKSVPHTMLPLGDRQFVLDFPRGSSSNLGSVGSSGLWVWTPPRLTILAPSLWGGASHLPQLLAPCLSSRVAVKINMLFLRLSRTVVAWEKNRQKLISLSSEQGSEDYRK